MRVALIEFFVTDEKNFNMLDMINTGKAGTGEMNVGDKVIEASLSDDKEFKTRGIQVMAGVMFSISE